MTEIRAKSSGNVKRVPPGPKVTKQRAIDEVLRRSTKARNPGLYPKDTKRATVEAASNASKSRIKPKNPGLYPKTQPRTKGPR